MISMLILSSLHQELPVLKKESKELAGTYTDETWQYYCFTLGREYKQFLKDAPLLNLAVLDVMMPDGISNAKYIRRNNKKAYFILIASASCSPLEYIRPDILAGSLLLRPFTKEQLHTVLKEAFLAYLSGRKEEAFVIENRDGRQVIPYGEIVYFEACDRRIWVHTQKKETSFYGTIERLERELPDRFVRCHRGFLIDRFRIRNVLLSQNTVILDGGYQIPLSRSYKASIKEMIHHAADG